MKDHRLDGKSFKVEFFNGGIAQIIGPGDKDRLIAVPGDKVFPVEVQISPAWPTIYFYTRADAIAFAHPRGGTFVELGENDSHPVTSVRWFVGTDRQLAFTDLKDVMLYALASDFGRA